MIAHVKKNLAWPIVITTIYSLREFWPEIVIIRGYRKS